MGLTHNIWSPQGRIGPMPYLVFGLGLATVKLALDSAVAWLLFGRVWLPTDYVAPQTVGRLLGLDLEERLFFGTLLLFSLPFAWVGVCLTVQRLRDAALSRWLVLLFFVPVANLLMFVVLALAPSPTPLERPASQGAGRHERWARWAPLGRGPSAVLAVFVTAMIGLSTTLMGAEVLEFYGAAMFVGGPFVVGLLAPVIYGWSGPRQLGESIAVGLLSLGVVAGLLVVFAIEGVICLVMAAPIALTLTVLGSLVGHAMHAAGHAGARLTVPMAGAVAALVGLMGAEAWVNPRPPLSQVVTAMEIDAPPAVVWDHVIAFPDLPAPRSWLFRLGVAYPTRATIEGEGVGAVRYCTFSTGSFVEPITTWDPPRRLAFDVTASPPAMQEWSWRDGVSPAHVEGYFAGERGQFELVALPGGRTRLVGTTWYRHAIWPQAYWRLWADAVVHRIHRRVLGHIGGLAERAAKADRS